MKMTTSLTPPPAQPTGRSSAWGILATALLSGVALACGSSPTGTGTPAPAPVAGDVGPGTARGSTSSSSGTSSGGGTSSSGATSSGGATSSSGATSSGGSTSSGAGTSSGGSTSSGAGTSSGGGSSSGGPVVTQAAVMPKISRGLPTYTNYGVSPAPSAVDSDYATVWRTGHIPSASDSNWLAIDLSSVPAATRKTVYSVWFNEYGYNYDTSDGSSYTLPGDIAVQANTAPGGGQPPTSGWTTLAAKTANIYSSGANMLDLTGYDWVRIDVTASAPNVAAQNTDTSLQWNLYDAHTGNDGWKFGGDSITANSMGHKSTNDSFDQLVHASASNDPAFEMAGHGGWSTATMLTNIDGFLADFPGLYFGLSLGTNDAPGNDAPTYLVHMTQLVDKVLAAGKVPVIPTIPYTGEPTHATIPAYNAQIEALYATYGAKLLHGPDLYTVLYDGRAAMFNNPTDLHPNETGNAAIRQAWAATMLKSVYGH